MRPLVASGFGWGAPSHSGPAVGEQILIIVDDRKVADDMAWELRRKGHAVDVREIQDDEELRPSRVRPPYSIG